MINNNVFNSFNMKSSSFYMARDLVSGREVQANKITEKQNTSLNPVNP